ncbi:MAG: hypothetical protein IJV33_08245, partial [Bacteroidaceae bacterium]|nr:hypothetical protein [Bacteroidaceae bacterium]
VTNIPVLTGEVAERFIEQCEYNAQHLRGSEWRGDFEDVYKDLIARSPILQKSSRRLSRRCSTATGTLRRTARWKPV